MDKNNDSPSKDPNYLSDGGGYEDELEGDLYLLALQKRLASMKKDRKKAEQDAQLLKNRLTLLKGEEDKVRIIKLKFLFFYFIDMEKG